MPPVHHITPKRLLLLLLPLSLLPWPSLSAAAGATTTTTTMTPRSSSFLPAIHHLHPEQVRSSHTRRRRAQVAQSHLVKLTAPDAADGGGGGDQYGSSVSIDGNCAVIGATGADDNGSRSGAAYALTRASGESWENAESVKLTPPPSDYPGRNHLFGLSVDVSEIVIGGISDGGGSGCRAIVGGYDGAYVFERVDDAWTRVAQLTVPPGGSDVDSDANAGFFGTSVSISGDVAVVGAPRRDYDMPNSNVDGVADAGAAYVYERSDGGEWVFVAELRAGYLITDGDNFGVSVAVSGDRVVVGANADNHDDGDGGPGGESSGSAHVFELQNGEWTFVQRLVASDAAEGDYFGRSVSIDGDVILVGATHRNSNVGLDSGAAYVFELIEDIWEQTAKLTAGIPGAYDWFGYDVSVRGDAALVGSPHDDLEGPGFDAGSAYVFRKQPTTGDWTLQVQLTPGDGDAGDQFGGAVSASDDTFLVGSSLDDTDEDGGGDGENGGSAYLFDRIEGTTSYPTSSLVTPAPITSTPTTSPPTASPTISPTTAVPSTQPPTWSEGDPAGASVTTTAGPTQTSQSTPTPTVNVTLAGEETSPKSTEGGGGDDSSAVAVSNSILAFVVLQLLAVVAALL